MQVRGRALISSSSLSIGVSMKKKGRIRMGKLHSVNFLDVIRASKHEKHLGQNSSQSIVNVISESSSIVPPSTHSHSQLANFQHTSDKTLGHWSMMSLKRRGNKSSMHKTSTFSKLRSKALIRKSKMSKQRRQKQQHGIKDTVVMIDHISKLPDCLLHHILSCIPTKEVVKTSVLSTRWKNLFVSVPNLDVDASEIHDWHPSKLTSFMNFLERVLHSRGSYNIKKLCLTCSDGNEESQVHSWISDAISHNVQELELNLYGPIPWSILNSASLTSLKITATFFGDLPSCFSLPCLKTLHLEYLMVMTDDELQKLLWGCPVVEELVLLDIWLNLNNILISNSTLKRLKIRDMLMFEADDDDDDDDFSICKIKIDAENLASFEYSGYLSNEILLDNVSSLVNWFVDFPPRHHPVWESVVADRASKLIQRLIDVQRATKVRVGFENAFIACQIKF